MVGELSLLNGALSPSYPLLTSSRNSGQCRCRKLPPTQPPPLLGHTDPLFFHARNEPPPPGCSPLPVSAPSCVSLSLLE